MSSLNSSIPFFLLSFFNTKIIISLSDYSYESTMELALVVKGLPATVEKDTVWNVDPYRPLEWNDQVDKLCKAVGLQKCTIHLARGTPALNCRLSPGELGIQKSIWLEPKFAGERHAGYRSYVEDYVTRNYGHQFPIDTTYSIPSKKKPQKRNHKPPSPSAFKLSWEATDPYKELMSIDHHHYSGSQSSSTITEEPTYCIVCSSPDPLIMCRSCDSDGRFTFFCEFGCFQRWHKHPSRRGHEGLTITKRDHTSNRSRRVSERHTEDMDTTTEGFSDDGCCYVCGVSNNRMRYCGDCQNSFCTNCFDSWHRHSSREHHKSIHNMVSKSRTLIKSCYICSTRVAEWTCTECNEGFCAGDCYTTWHKNPRRGSHELPKPIHNMVQSTRPDFIGKNQTQKLEHIMDDRLWSRTAGDVICDLCTDNLAVVVTLDERQDRLCLDCLSSNRFDYSCLLCPLLRACEVCVNDEHRPALFHCDDCKLSMCPHCFAFEHTPHDMQKHPITNLYNAARSFLIHLLPCYKPYVRYVVDVGKGPPDPLPSAQGNRSLDFAGFLTLAVVSPFPKCLQPNSFTRQFRCFPQEIILAKSPIAESHIQENWPTALRSVTSSDKSSVSNLRQIYMETGIIPFNKKEMNR